MLFNIPPYALKCRSCGGKMVNLRCSNGCRTREQSLEYMLQTTGEIASQEERILLAIAAYGPISRNGLAKVFEKPENKPRIRLSSVCGRTKNLMDQGLVYVYGHEYDQETQRVVEVLAYKKEKPEQIRMML